MSSERAPGLDRADALHREALVMDGASFFLKGHDEDVAASGVDSFNIMAPWPGDDLAQAVTRLEDHREMIAGDPRLELAETVDDIAGAKSRGNVAVVLGAQDSSFIGNRLARLDTFHRLGLRYMQLTYNYRNLVGDGCAEPVDAGLSAFGREVVRALPQVGIVMDVSHAGPVTALEALKLAKAPAMASHSNPRGLYENRRNVTDDVIRAIADTGGVVGCTLPSPFNYAGGDEPPTLEHFARAVEYVIELVGDDHVAIGSDLVATAGAYHPDLSAALRSDLYAISGQYYGKFGLDPKLRKVQGITAMREYPRLTRLLLDRGHHEERVRKIVGGNLLRVYTAAWRG